MKTYFALPRVMGAALAICAMFPSYAAIPAMPEIPVYLPDSVRQPLIAKRQPLALRKLALIEMGNAINKSCANLEKDSSLHRSCLSRKRQFDDDVEALSVKMGELEEAVIAAMKAHTIASMKALAKRLGWSAAEQTRLVNALSKLGYDGGSGVTSAEIRRAWQDILDRGPDGDIARKAVAGAGPGLPGAGTQTYMDCAVFALASAAEVPYGVVAARAAELIRQGEWRSADDRSNPQRVMEQKGLNSGEVVMLAEALGQADVVPSRDFAKTLKEGRSVLVSVVPSDGDVRSGHQVLLIKTFQNDGETWFEMMDSNQGPQRRLYLSAKELNTLLQETGVAFRPEPGTTVKLLR